MSPMGTTLPGSGQVLAVKLNEFPAMPGVPACITSRYSLRGDVLAATSSPGSPPDDGVSISPQPTASAAKSGAVKPIAVILIVIACSPIVSHVLQAFGHGAVSPSALGREPRDRPASHLLRTGWIHAVRLAEGVDVSPNKHLFLVGGGAERALDRSLRIYDAKSPAGYRRIVEN